MSKLKSHFIKEENIMHSTANGSNHQVGRNCCKGNWSGINIAAMVIGFVLFWPVGLVILYWNISGRNIKDLPSAVQEKWSAFTNGSFSSKANTTNGTNTVFDEFQQTQHDRISELKEEIKNRAQRFNIFKSDAKRQADEAEFKDFMANKPDHLDNEK
jgi:hypothetical protein